MVYAVNREVAVKKKQEFQVCAPSLLTILDAKRGPLIIHVLDFLFCEMNMLLYIRHDLYQNPTILGLLDADWSWCDTALAAVS